MDHFVKENIITLGDSNSYVITQVLDYNGKKYLHLIKLEEDEELTDEYKLVYVVQDYSGNYGINEVTDTSELAELNQMIITMFELDYQ